MRKYDIDLIERNPSAWVLGQLKKFPGISTKKLYKRCGYSGSVEWALENLLKDKRIICTNRRWFLNEMSSTTDNSQTPRAKMYLGK